VGVSPSETDLLTGDELGAWARYQRFTIHAGAE